AEAVVRSSDRARRSEQPQLSEQPQRPEQPQRSEPAQTSEQAPPSGQVRPSEPAQTSDPSRPSQQSPPSPPAPEPAGRRAAERVTVAEPPGPPPPPAAADPRPAVESIVAAYADAIESRSTTRIREVFPGLTATQERDWRQFFEAVEEVQATLTVTDLDVVDDVAEATATGEYVFENSTTRRTERQPASVRMTLRRSADNIWRLTAVR